MALPIVGGLGAWLVGLVGSSFTTFATWMVARFAYEKGIQYALITAFLVAAGGLMVTLSLTIKALILGAQVAMPPTLQGITAFIPHNVNQVFSIIITVRVSMTLYRWTVATMSAYLPTNPKHGLML